jgi:hypothetical protein
MLSLLANDYLAHCVELLEAEERASEMMHNISLDSNVIADPAAAGRHSVPSATITSQDVLGEYNCKSIYKFASKNVDHTLFLH